MSTIRRFLVAPALVRLIRKERGGARITEGHFAPQGGRNSYVRVDGQVCQLVLVNGGVEERTDVPRAHGDALLDVCPGKAAYDRTSLSVAGREVQIDRYVTPGSLDVISVAFDSDDDASAFQAPAWFGREVSAEPAYERQTLAIQGVPAAEEASLSNAALDAVLDLIEPRFGFGRYGNARPADPAEGIASALRRPAAPPVPPPAPEPAAQEAVQEAARQEPAHPEHAPAEPPHHEPAPEQTAHHEAGRPAAEAAPQEPAHDGAQPPHTAEAVHGDARIDDVIESLSQALGAAIQQPEPKEGKGEDSAPIFERWTVRPRRTQQQN
jgi:CYTH domain-containing protein